MSLLFNFLNYFFEPLPDIYFKYSPVVIAIAVITFLASIGVRVCLKQKKEDKILKKMFRNLPGKLQIISILMALYLLARYENMPYFSMRIVNYVLIGSLIYVVVKSIRIYLKDYPEAKKLYLEQKNTNRYIPGKKK